MTATQLQIALSPIINDNGDCSPAIQGINVKVKLYGRDVEFYVKYASYDAQQDGFIIVIDEV